MKCLSTILLLLISVACSAQHFHECKQYYYKGTDSLNKHLIRIQTFNDRGKIIYEEHYENCADDDSVGYSINCTGHSYYFYRGDTLLIKKIVSNLALEDSTYNTYCYDIENRLISDSEYQVYNGRYTWGVDSVFRTSHTTLYRHRKNGNIAEDSTFVGANKFSVTRSFYDKKRKLIRTEGYGDNFHVGKNGYCVREWCEVGSARYSYLKNGMKIVETRDICPVGIITFETRYNYTFKNEKLMTERKISYSKDAKGHSFPNSFVITNYGYFPEKLVTRVVSGNYDEPWRDATVDYIYE